MNPTRVLGALLLVVGVSWFLAVPAILPAAYHGHVHTGHEHAQYAAQPVDAGGQSKAALTAASENAVVVGPNRDWVVAEAGSLTDLEQSAFEDAVSGEANATESPTRDQYRRLAEDHPFVQAESGQWFELALTQTANYTRITATPVETPAVTRAVAGSPGALSGPTGSQAQTLARTDGPVLVSSPSLPTPLYLSRDGDVLRVVHIGDAPEPPSLSAFVLFLLPGAVLALLGGYLERTT